MSAKTALLVINIQKAATCKDIYDATITDLKRIFKIVYSAY